MARQRKAVREALVDSHVQLLAPAHIQAGHLCKEGTVCKAVEWSGAERREAPKTSSCCVAAAHTPPRHLHTQHLTHQGPPNHSQLHNKSCRAAHLRHALDAVARQGDEHGGGRLAIQHVCGSLANRLHPRLACPDACRTGEGGWEGGGLQLRKQLYGGASVSKWASLEGSAAADALATATALFARPLEATQRTSQVLVRILQVPVLEPPHPGQGSRGGAPQPRCAREARRGEIGRQFSRGCGGARHSSRAAAEARLLLRQAAPPHGGPRQHSTARHSTHRCSAHRRCHRWLLHSGPEPPQHRAAPCAARRGQNPCRQFSNRGDTVCGAQQAGCTLQAAKYGETGLHA